MLLWFVATAVLIVHFVFTDPSFDHRFLILGVLLPDAVDGITGGAWVLHSVTGAVAMLTVVMVGTIGRRSLRRRLIAVPIGVLLHLVVDGAFTATDVFWWPFSGGFDDAALPVMARGWWNLPLELVGATLLWWAWRRFGLSDRTRRERFVREGRLELAPVSPRTPPR